MAAGTVLQALRLLSEGYAQAMGTVDYGTSPPFKKMDDNNTGLE
jgi:hypothetical protein